MRLTGAVFGSISFFGDFLRARRLTGFARRFIIVAAAFIFLGTAFIGKAGSIGPFIAMVLLVFGFGLSSMVRAFGIGQSIPLVMRPVFFVFKGALRRVAVTRLVGFFTNLTSGLMSGTGREGWSVNAPTLREKELTGVEGCLQTDQVADDVVQQGDAVKFLHDSRHDGHCSEFDFRKISGTIKKHV